MSQVLQCTQFDGFRLMRLPLGWRRVVDHFVDVRRAEILAGAAEFLHAARVADIRVVNDQMRGLIFFVLRPGVVEIGEFVECQLAVALGRANQMLLGAAVEGKEASLRICSYPA